jgi:hypothetical protein
MLLVRLIGEAPSVTGSIAPTLQPIPSRQRLYSYAQFFGQRWHVVVGYQGSEKIFDYNPEWAVKVIRERAILAFRLTQCKPPLSLFNLSGAELPDMASTDAAGINPGDHLVLGPSKVNSGTIIGCRASFMWRTAPNPGGVIQEGPVPWVRVIRCSAPGAAQKIQGCEILRRMRGAARAAMPVLRDIEQTGRQILHRVRRCAWNGKFCRHNRSGTI